MTSQKSLNNVRLNDFKRSLMGSLSFPTVAFAVLFSFITVPILKYFSKFDFVSEGLLYCFIRSDTVFYNSFYLLQIGMILCGMMTATQSFKFILSKKQVNVYFSLGLTRTSIFLNRLLASAVTLLLSVFIPITVIFCANIACLGISAELVKVYLFFMISLFVCGMVGFSIASFGISVSGSVFESSFASLAISFISTIITVLISELKTNFLKGYVMNYSTESIADFFSPWTFVKPTATKSFFYEDAENFVTVDKLIHGYQRELLTNGKLPEACQADSTFFLPVIIWLGVAILILGAALFLFNRRKAENSNSIGKFAVSRVIIGSTLFGISLYIGLTIFDAKIVGVIIVPCIAAVVYFLTQLLLTRKIKDTLKSMSACAILEAVFILFLITCSTGCFGLYNKLPEKEDIKSVSLSITGIDFVSNIPIYDDGYVESTNPKDIDMTVELFEKIKNDSGKDGENITVLYFTVTDKDGEKMQRAFKVWDRALYAEYLQKTVDSDFFDAVLENQFIGFDKNNKSKDGQYTYLETVNSYYVSNYGYYYDKIEESAVTYFKLFDSQMITYPYSDDETQTDMMLVKGDELATALYNDISKMTYQQLLKNSSKPVVVMGTENNRVFNAQSKFEAIDYIYNGYYYTYAETEEIKEDDPYAVLPYICVYPEMTETLAYFEANGMTPQKSYEGKVKQILYTNCRQPINNVIGEYIESNEDKYHGIIDYDYLTYMYDIYQNDFFSSGYFHNDSLERLGGFIIDDTTNLDILKTVYSDLQYNLTSVDESKFDRVLSGCVPQYYTYNDNGKVVYIIYEDGSVICQYLPQSNLSVLQ